MIVVNPLKILREEFDAKFILSRKRLGITTWLTRQKIHSIDGILRFNNLEKGNNQREN